MYRESKKPPYDDPDWPRLYGPGGSVPRMAPIGPKKELPPEPKITLSEKIKLGWATVRRETFEMFTAYNKTDS